MPRINILFIIPSLHMGGSERVIITLLKNFDYQNFDIKLLLLNKEGILIDEIPKHIKVIDLKIKRVRYAIFRIVREIWRIKPDLVFSTLGHLNLLIASFKIFMPASTKFIARESSTISSRNKQEVYPRLFDFLFKTVYKNFDRIVCPSCFMKTDLIENYHIPAHKIEHINNPIDFEYILEKAQTNIILLPKNKVNFIAVGRLGPEKGYDRMLQALQLCTQQNIHLSIIGSGSERLNLEQFADTSEVASKVGFLGFQKNPYQYMAQARCLLLASYYEGLPNVILEANACGIPVIAFRCPGVDESLIENEVNGFLIEGDSVQEYAKAMDYLENFTYSKSDIINRIVDNYRKELIIGKYKDLFLKELSMNNKM